MHNNSGLASFLQFVLRKESFIVLVVVILLLQVRFYQNHKDKSVSRPGWSEEDKKFADELKKAKQELYNDEEDIEDEDTEVNFVYGNKDYRPKQSIVKKWTDPNYKLRVLFLQAKHDYDQHMDRWFQQTVDAARRNKRIEVVDLWGIGWPGWRNDQESHINIQSKYGKVDVIHCHELHPAPARGTVADVNSGFFHEIQCLDGLGKCKEPEGFKFLDIVHLAYANTGIYVLPYSGGKLITNLPHGSPKELFYKPYDDQETRDIDILLIGKVSGLYPLRSVVYNYILEGKIPGVIRGHPGYYIWEFAKENYPNLTQVDQTVSYAEQIKRSKIVILCSSVRRFALRKYIEASLAGALLVGDIPAERQEEYKEYVVEIDKDMPSEKMKDILEYYLSHETERLALAKRGQEINLEKYTYDSFVENLIDNWKDYLLHGLRGFHFKHPVQITKPWCIPVGGNPHDCGVD